MDARSRKGAECVLWELERTSKKVEFAMRKAYLQVSARK